MTLIEIMIVIVIIALAATAMTFGLGALTRTRLRSGCVKVMAATRYAYNRAVSQGTTTRVLFDLDADTLAIEEAHGRITLARLSDPRRGGGDPDEDGAAVDPWAAAQQRLEETIRPTFGQSAFSPIRSADGQPLSRYGAQRLAEGVSIVQLITPHEPSPRDGGRGAIYFFPHGMTERAVVQLSDGTNVYSVELHPLTGRGKIHTFPFEPEPIREGASDEDLSEVEDTR